VIAIADWFLLKLFIMNNWQLPVIFLPGYFN
jgi:hypothetical protein